MILHQNFHVSCNLSIMLSFRSWCVELLRATVESGVDFLLIYSFCCVLMDGVKC